MKFDDITTAIPYNSNKITHYYNNPLILQERRTLSFYTLCK